MIVTKSVLQPLVRLKFYRRDDHETSLSLLLSWNLISGDKHGPSTSQVRNRKPDIGAAALYKLFFSKILKIEIYWNK